MIELLEVIIISIVQGIGEFLPISSSGHLVVTNRLFNLFGDPITGDGGDFIKLSVLLHVGTLVAVLVVFRQRILELFGKEVRLIPLLIVGTIPAGVIGILVKKKAPWIAEDLFVTATCFAVTALLLIVSTRFMKGEKTCSTMTWLDALLIGMVQAVAILPGISRSGSTIVAGLCCRLRRDEAATFSFLLAIPVIGGGGLLEIKDLLDATPSDGALPASLLIVGMLVSCVVGILALTWLLDWLKKGKLWFFSLWLAVMCPVTFALGMMPVPGQSQNTSETVTAMTLQEDAGNGKIAGESKPSGDKDVANDSGTKKADKTENAASESSNSKKSNADDPSGPAPEAESLRKAVESVEDSGRLNLSREEAQREYERILAEEEAKEQALLEEERKRVPLVDEPEKLKRIGEKDQLWITPDGKSVVILGRIALREGFLELFACRIGTKEHESIVSVRLQPQLIHVGLLLVGAEPGKPVQVQPKFIPPSGDEIEIKIHWLDEKGERKEALAQDWVWDANKSKEDAKVAMTSNWVFTGSMIYRDESGKNHYVANESGELFGLSNFVGSILDLPFQSSADNAELMFGCFTERIPELATPVTLILTPVKNKKKTGEPAGKSGENPESESPEKIGEAKETKKTEEPKEN